MKEDMDWDKHVYGDPYRQQEYAQDAPYTLRRFANGAFVVLGLVIALYLTLVMV